MLVLDKKDFAAATATVAKFIANRPVVPAALATRLILAGDKLTVSSYDYETAATVTVEPLQTTGEIDIAVSGRVLAALVAKAPGRDVRIVLDGTTANITSGRASFKMATIAEPIDAPGPSEPTATVDVDQLRQAVKRVQPAASSDLLMPVFTGILLRVDDDELTLLATDRYRIAEARIPVSGTFGPALVPARTLADAIKSAPDGEVGLAIHQDRLSIIAWPLQIDTALIGNEFPKVRHLLDFEPTVQFTADPTELLAAVTRAGLVAERNTPVTITAENGQLRLQAAGTNDLLSEETLDADVVNDGVLRFNPNYLRDAITCAGGETIRIAGIPNKPALITGDDPDNYRHAVMTMRGSS